MVTRLTNDAEMQIYLLCLLIISFLTLILTAQSNVSQIYECNRGHCTPLGDEIRGKSKDHISS